MLEVRLAGGIALRADGAELAPPASRRGRAVLAYLALHPGAHNRAQLAARRALIRRQGSPEFPAWPFDDSVARLLKLAIRGALTAAGFPTRATADLTAVEPAGAVAAPKVRVAS